MSPPDPGPLTGRVVLVIGASSGIGRATAAALVAAGATVVGVARHEKRLRAVPDIEPLAGDLTVATERNA